MNGNPEKDQDAYRSILLLSEIEEEAALSQRDMAHRPRAGQPNLLRQFLPHGEGQC